MTNVTTTARIRRHYSKSVATEQYLLTERFTYPELYRIAFGPAAAHVQERHVKEPEKPLKKILYKTYKDYLDEDNNRYKKA